MTAFVLVLVAAVITAAGWMLFELVPPTRPGRRPAAVAITAITAAAIIVILFAGTAGGRLQTLQGIFALVLAVCGGAILTIAVFEHIDSGADNPFGMEAAGQVLRGGAWIGVLERVAIFGTLVIGWPQGIAVVLAVKALGRYPELRNPGDPAAIQAIQSSGPAVPAGHRPSAATERFIIGTLVSFIWAAACAYLATGS